MTKIKTNTSQATSKSRQPFWTITRDNVDNSYREDIIAAANAEEARVRAVQVHNLENDIDPDEAGGFESVLAINQGGLRRLLA